MSCKSDSSGHTSPPDLAPSSLQDIVGWWQGLLDDVGRVWPSLIDRLAPSAPRALCGYSLVITDDDEQAIRDATSPGTTELPFCPTCVTRAVR